ncbi:MAG TPA: hypothetical protein VK530_10195 [Candidatus Acidoferrum sp.]|nr:hypothetical protein [Candidatus Acidoferrum sp.]
MLLLIIEPDATDPVPSDLNVQFDEEASAEDMRAAWESLLSGKLKKHLFDAISLECIKRRIDPRDIVAEPTGN